jgi:hypothetical protein
MTYGRKGAPGFTIADFLWINIQNLEETELIVVQEEN